MPNLRRGEIEAVLDGRAQPLCLTLGALAELEAAFGDEDMLALARRFETGSLSARDCIRIIGAGLRGAGSDVTDEMVSRMQTDGGAAGYVTIVAALLRATFGGPASEPRGGPSTSPFPAPTQQAKVGKPQPAVPSHGTM